MILPILLLAQAALINEKYLHTSMPNTQFKPTKNWQPKATGKRK